MLLTRRIRQVSLLETKKGKGSQPSSGALSCSLQIKDVNRYPDSPHEDTTATPRGELYFHENTFATCIKVYKVTASLPVVPEQVSLTVGLYMHKIQILELQQQGIKTLRQLDYLLQSRHHQHTAQSSQPLTFQNESL